MDTREFPANIICELTNRCDGLTCRNFCPRKIMEEHEGLGDMDWQLFVKLMYEIHASNQNPDITLHRRGESTLYSHFDEALVLARAATKGKLLLATNSVTITKGHLNSMLENLDFVNFSITPESDLESIYYFIDTNKQQERHAEVQVSAVEHPNFDRGEFIRLWQPQVDRVRIYTCHSLDGQPGSLGYGRGPRKTCVKPFTELAIHWNGKIVACNHRWLSEPNLGDANTQSLKEIWNGAAYVDLREQQHSLKLKDTLCIGCDCWYDTEDKQGTGEVIK